MGGFYALFKSYLLNYISVCLFSWVLNKSFTMTQHKKIREWNPDEGVDKDRGGGRGYF